MKRFLPVAMFCIAMTAGAAFAGDDKDKKTTETAAAAPVAVKVIANKHCPIMTEKEVDENSKIVTYKGQTIRLCCKKCVKKFDSDPDKYLAAAIADAK